MMRVMEREEDRSDSAWMDASIEKLLPQNVEAEAGVLGSILIDPQAMVGVAEILTAEDFWLEAHRVIFAAALDLFTDGVAADLITLTDELARRGQLEDIGGVSAVSSLANNVPTSANADYYADIVARTATMRALIRAAGQVAAIAYNDPDAVAALEQAEKLIAQVAQRVYRRERAHSLAEGMGDLLTKLGALSDHEPGALIGVPSGYRDLDALLGGLQRSDLILLAARPAIGKTSFALSIAHNVAKQGQGVLFFSLEMSEEQVIQRLLAMESSVDVQALRTGRLSEQEWNRVWDAAARITDLPLFVDEKAGLSLTELQARCRRHVAQHPETALIVVDYIQLMQGASGGQRGGNRESKRTEELGEISRGVKQLAKELNLPILALSQLSRAVESRQDKRPMLSDLAESGSLERDCDVCCFLHREEVYNAETTRKHIADVIIAKHRNGPVGNVSLFFQAAQTRFLNLERRSGETSDQLERQPWWSEGEGEGGPEREGDDA